MRYFFLMLVLPFICFAQEQTYEVVDDTTKARVLQIDQLNLDVSVSFEPEAGRVLGSSKIKFKTLEAVPEAACMLHKGPYETLHVSYQKLYKWMEQNGYETSVAFSGEEAMETVAASHPNLILLDIMLPIIDGFEVCQSVRENPEWNDIRIILLTAMGSEANIAKGLALGADAYITKPFSNSEVIAKVRELICQ